MTKCNAEAHPYCTQPVLDGELVCVGGHLQQQERGNVSGAVLAGDMHIHFSGYDPRAAGGRQTMRLELRGALAQTLSLCCTQLQVQLRSDLIDPALSRHHFLRTASGQWRPLQISFSSKNKDYGQYLIDVELCFRTSGAPIRRWTCTAVILVPRPDATLTEIHRVFLGAQKNVKVSADDGAIAKLSGFSAYAQAGVDLEISASNAAIAQVDLAAPIGKYEVAPGSIAWDEELIEECVGERMEEDIADGNTEQKAQEPAAELTVLSEPSDDGSCAALFSAGPQGKGPIRLLALDHWVLGRLEVQNPKADILLAHQGEGKTASTDSTASTNLTRRISASHAVIRRSGDGAEITDVSRYGLMLDGVALEKGTQVVLKTGMQIELCASVKGIVCLQVSAIFGHLVILQRSGKSAGDEVLYLLTPETRPDIGQQDYPDGLPQVFHAQGRFWHVDSQTGRQTAISARSVAGGLHNIAPNSSYRAAPYDDLQVRGYGLWRKPLMPALTPN